MNSSQPSQPSQPSFATKAVRLVRHPSRLWCAIKWRTWDRAEQYLDAQRVARSIRVLTAKTEAEYDALRPQVLSYITSASTASLMAYADELRNDTAFLNTFDKKLTEVYAIDPQVTTSMIDITTLYCLLRVLKPQILVETGVYFGGTSAFLLRALERNERGHLYSIDYLIPGVQPFGHPLGQGCLVPKTLQHRWTLINGDSRVELPKLLAQQGAINFFLHDSLHTHAHMTWEYETAWAALTPGSVLTSHDIALTNAFQKFAQRHKHEANASGIVCNVGLARKN
jgi:cephalosporin hydroxylase